MSKFPALPCGSLECIIMVNAMSMSSAVALVGNSNGSGDENLLWLFGCLND